jgi:hypothetical protein
MGRRDESATSRSRSGSTDWQHFGHPLVLPVFLARPTTAIAACSWTGWSCSSPKRGHARDDDAGNEFVNAAKDKGDQFILWEVDGNPVSMAMLRAPAFGVSRIGPVFTPRDRRGHGYGSAVTAGATGPTRRSGTADVVLFADLANPVSNAIYQRIGFEAVADSVRIDFVSID